MERNIRLNKIYIIRLLVILVLVSALVIMRKIETGFLIYSNGANVLDMRFGYSASDVFQLFTTLGAEGRSIYVKYLLDDFIFTVVFAIVQNYILKFIMGKAVLNSKWHVLLYIAYLRAFFDVIENIIILILLNSFPSMLLSLITAASSVTRLKFIVYGIWILTVPISLVVRLIMRKKAKVGVI
ncbi:hypothetical protein [Clostridium sp. AWRP]|uniref:hypothetical protein n=1 Tax=Clostridium sp. AWRP TaxID=2212991 RepID=UPI000FDB9255|nr:hypothetical protein [Clostridium sp. AWRP]AZV57871.1 hypothetical protein DMR38_15360 [Clostridium sp. AWRP]